MFLVTGFPRSATNYTKALLREIELEIRGEQFGRIRDISEEKTPDGVVSWQHLDLFKDRFTTVLHQLRHPLKVISSSQTLLNNTFRRIFKATGSPRKWSYQLHLRRFSLISDEKIIYWTMCSWLGWNELIERDERTALRFRIENIENRWEEISKLIGVENKEMPVIRKDVNTRKSRYDKLDWRDLYEISPNLTKEIIKKAEIYGYEIGNEI